MPLGETILKKLNKPMPPSATVNMKVGKHDMVVQTNDEGKAVLLFIGRLTDDGMIKGERYARNLKYDRDGKLIKDHWDNKGRC